MSNYNREINRRYGYKKEINKKPYIIVIALLVVTIIVLTILGIMSVARKNKNLSSQAASAFEMLTSSSNDNDSSQNIVDSSDIADSSVSSSGKSSETSSKTSSVTSSNIGFAVSAFVGQVDDWKLMLANRSNVMANYIPSNLKELPEEYCQESGYYVDERIYENAIKMIEDARKDGIKLNVLSAYRTVASQTSKFKDKVAYYKNKGYSQSEAEALAETIIARPGTSDHGLGLAIDFNYLEQSDENKPELVWLKNNSAKYGFVMRYKKDKQNITGVSYEPWHYRYVGAENAAIMNSKNMCLEEYVEYLIKNS